MTERMEGLQKRVLILERKVDHIEFWLGLLSIWSAVSLAVIILLILAWMGVI